MKNSIGHFPMGITNINNIVDEVENGLTEGFEAVGLMCPSVAFKSRLVKELKDKSWGLGRIERVHKNTEKALLDGQWLPAVCFDVLNRVSFPHSLVLDTGSFCTIGEHIWRAGPNRLFMGSSNGRYMGGAIPCAIGLAICKSHLPVFCVMGDGGIRSYPAEIKLAVQEELPICFVLMKDGRYSSVASIPQPIAMSQRAVTVFNPSWWEAVEKMGCEAHLVDSESSFATAVQVWNQKGPLFLEASFDAESYSEMTRRLR